MLYIFSGLIGFIAGAISYAWWIHADYVEYRDGVKTLEAAMTRQSLMYFKEIKKLQGVEVDIDDARL